MTSGTGPEPSPPAATGSRTAAVVAAALGIGFVVGVVAAVLVALQLRSVVGTSLEAFDFSADADCDAVVHDEGLGDRSHVGPGTVGGGPLRVPYSPVPPASGPHAGVWQFPSSALYTAQDRPPVEVLVHNLEHGYTILWYDESLDPQQVAELGDLSTMARENPATRGKFIAVAWNASYGPLPSDRPTVLTHWTATGGVRQACAELSSEAVRDFITTYPAADSPEPDAP